MVVSNFGSNPVNITGISERGTDFTVPSLPSYTVGPNHTISIPVNFSPQWVATYGGHVWIKSTDSSGNQHIAEVWVHGLGTTSAAAPEVDLTWEEPNRSPVQIAGYLVFRATSQNGAFSQIDSLQSQTSYVDQSVTPGATYYYQVESVAPDGTTSNPSSIYAVQVPAQ